MIESCFLIVKSFSSTKIEILKHCFNQVSMGRASVFFVYWWMHLHFWPWVYPMGFIVVSLVRPLVRLSVCGEKYSSELNRVIYDFKLASNKVNYSKKNLTLLLNQHHFQYYFCVTIMSSPLAWSREIWFPLPLKYFSPSSQNFQFPLLPLKIPNFLSHPESRVGKTLSK